MDNTKSADYFDVVRRSLEGYNDHRLLSKDELEAVLWYVVYIFDETLKFGGDWTGVSFSQKDLIVLMVSRREYEGTPQVVFVTGRTTADCMRIFRNRFVNGTLNWFRDKFR